MNISVFRQGIQREGLEALIKDLPKGLIMAEIGVWAGEASKMFLDSGKIFKFYAIDIWTTPQDQANEAEIRFDNNILLKYNNVIKYKMTFPDAVARGLIPPLDFVYIDGNHNYAFVKKDINYVLNVMKPNFIIGGHDYSVKYKDRVVKAVNEMIGKPDRIYKDSSWIKKL